MAQDIESAAPSTRDQDGFAVCVFCGARAGEDPAAAQQAARLGAGLAGMGARLVYGAGDLGLMGAVSGAARAAGGKTMGVIPRGLWEREVRRRPLPEDVIVESLHHRKSVMLANADAVVTLPGGIGTLDEMIETVSWRQLGLHDKPIIAVDTGGYWAPLRAMFERMRQSGFLYGPLEELIEFVADADAALAALARLRASQSEP